MRALTLHQPWASLVALGVKTIETRSWSTSYRGPLAVHAAKRLPELRFVGNYDVSYYPTADEWVLTGPASEHAFPVVMPLGAVVATCTLVDVVPMVDARDRLSGAWMRHVAETLNGELRLWNGPSETENPSTGRPTWRCDVIEDQRPFGDFTPGRFAWLLADIEALPEPIPARGRQQLWEWAA